MKIPKHVCKENQPRLSNQEENLKTLFQFCAPPLTTVYVFRLPLGDLLLSSREGVLPDSPVFVLHRVSVCLGARSPIASLSQEQAALKDHITAAPSPSGSHLTLVLRGRKAAVVLESRKDGTLSQARLRGTLLGGRLRNF